MLNFNSELRRIDDEISTVAADIAAINLQYQESKDSIDILQQSMAALHDQKSKFIRKIPAKFRDVEKVYEWLNQNSSRFQGEVYGPIGMHIKVILRYWYIIYLLICFLGG